MKSKVLQLAAIIDAKGAAWNLQTCDGFARGAWNNEVNPVINNVFRTITSGNYSDNIEIDPRPKTSDTILYNIADTWHYLDTLGCFPTQTAGGFLYSTQNPVDHPIDWWQFQDTIIAKSSPWEKWKGNLMWGAGSYTPHTNDLNDYGIWLPSAVSYTETFDSFYVHNPNNTVWYIGNGCQPVQSLDSLESIHDVLDPLRDFIDSIQNDLLPQNNFYVYSVTINQREFGPMLYQKISDFCDTINDWGTSKIVWGTLTEKFAEFETWQTTTQNQYSQWNCGQFTSVGLPVAHDKFGFYSVFPNPSSGIYQIAFNDNEAHLVEVVDQYGHPVWEKVVFDQEEIDLRNNPSGIYFLRIDKLISEKIIKN